MAAKNRWKQAQVLRAIKGSGGIVSTVAKRMKCDWRTANRYVNKWNATVLAMENERETVLDVCESTLVRSITQGDTHSAKWYLTKKGRHRGYDDVQEVSISGKDGGPLKVESTSRMDFGQLDAEELRNLIALMDKACIDDGSSAEEARN